MAGRAVGRPRPPRATSRYPCRPMRALLAVGGLLAVLGLGLMIVGVQQQISFAGCGERCVQPSSLPVTGGILRVAGGRRLLFGGAFVVGWGLAASHAARVLHPAPDQLVERRRLREVGLRGRARAVTWTEPGTSPTGEPLLDVDLSIELPGRPPYRAQHRIAVARRHLSRLCSGRARPGRGGAAA